MLRQLAKGRSALAAHGLHFLPCQSMDACTIEPRSDIFFEVPPNSPTGSLRKKLAATRRIAYFQGVFILKDPLTPGRLKGSSQDSPPRCCARLGFFSQSEGSALRQGLWQTDHFDVPFTTVTKGSRLLLRTACIFSHAEAWEKIPYSKIC